MQSLFCLIFMIFWVRIKWKINFNRQNARKCYMWHMSLHYNHDDKYPARIQTWYLQVTSVELCLVHINAANNTVFEVKSFGSLIISLIIASSSCDGNRENDLYEVFHNIVTIWCFWYTLTLPMLIFINVSICTKNATTDQSWFLQLRFYCLKTELLHFQAEVHARIQGSWCNYSKSDGYFRQVWLRNETNGDGNFRHVW